MSENELADLEEELVDVSVKWWLELFFPDIRDPVGIFPHLDIHCPWRTKLYAALDDRDKRINKLEQNADLVAKEDNCGRGLLLLDVEKYQNEVLECRDIIVELQAQLHQSQTERERLADDKRQLQGELSSQKLQLENQSKSLATATRLSNDAQSQRNDGCGEQYRLELENQS